MPQVAMCFNWPEIKAKTLKSSQTRAADQHTTLASTSKADQWIAVLRHNGCGEVSWARQTGRHNRTAGIQNYLLQEKSDATFSHTEGTDQA